MFLTITRHCVPSDPETGLSPLQTQLLNHPARIRIADAPTGAGKSYAFQRAMVDKHARILFIVPTRRLAQNLKHGLLELLTTKEGWEEKKAKAKVAVWSSDERERLEAAGELELQRITSRRLREIYELDPTRTGGEMILAIPEVVNYLLLRNISFLGQAETGIFDILAQFDHIVFDEFHTIEPRGFGLAAVMAKLACEFPSCRAKISFLSATPLNIKPVLLKLGITDEECWITELSETVETQAKVTPNWRTVHGEVTLAFKEVDSLEELFTQHLADIQAELAARRQVVLIYNNLGNLQRQITALEGEVRKSGIIRPEQCLLINSIDDSQQGEELDTQFVCGRHNNPLQFKLLIATSSVEMGVTFDTRLLLMEPGFEPLNFFQRYGRAARGDVTGKVIVRWDEKLVNKMPWLRELLKWVEPQTGKRLEIGDLKAVLSKKVTRTFKTQSDSDPEYFGHLPNRAVYSAGLYWYVLHKDFSRNRYIKEKLFRHAPKATITVTRLLGKVRKMAKDEIFKESAQKWCDRFEQEVRIFRNIERRIRVVSGDGKNKVFISEHFLQRETFILERGWVTMGSDGLMEVHLQAGWRNYLRKPQERPFVPLHKLVYFPHTTILLPLPVDAELANRWGRALLGKGEFVRDMNCQDAWQRYPKSMQAAKDLVSFTGLVVCDDNNTELDASSGVL